MLDTASKVFPDKVPSATPGSPLWPYLPPCTRQRPWLPSSVSLFSPPSEQSTRRRVGSTRCTVLIRNPTIFHQDGGIPAPNLSPPVHPHLTCIVEQEPVCYNIRSKVSMVIANCVASEKALAISEPLCPYLWMKWRCNDCLVALL